MNDVSWEESWGGRAKGASAAHFVLKTECLSGPFRTQDTKWFAISTGFAAMTIRTEHLGHHSLRRILSYFLPPLSVFMVAS